MTILIFFLVLFVLILVHEWGHFIVAKKTGMRVDEFGIGFPPKLFGIKKGETEYTFNALPIGGFVRIFGENAEDAAQAEAQGQDYSRSFTAKSKWAQTAVLIAGVTMNVLFAWLLFVVVFMMGIPTAVEEDKATDGAQLIIANVVKDSPADEAGIPVGGVIKSYRADTEDEELRPSAFRSHITDSSEGPITITYEAGGQEKTVEVTPKAGLISDDQDLKAIGVTPELVETVRRPFVEAVVEATVMTYRSTIAIVVGLGNLLRDIAQLDADLSQVAGPVGIVGLVGDAAEFGFSSLLMFTAVISLNLAVINLLPFPALDGGRLVFVAIESITRKPINPVWVARLNTIGFVLLMALMFAVTYSDIAKLI
jgi:regulator of sigma E protease